MRIFTLKELFLAVTFMLFCCMAIHAADDDLITKQITIKLDEAGTLPSKISDGEKNKITNMKIVGEINGTDVKFIREMAGSDYNGSLTDGKLAILDLSDAKIVEGGDTYYTDKTTEKNIVGYRFFYGCRSLTNVELPSNLTSIGKYAFTKCSGLISVEIPSSVTNIGGHAFSHCTSLMSIVIPSCVTSIEDCVFRGCSSMASVVIPSSVTSIKKQAFTGCSSLTSVDIPLSVTNIEDDAFFNCI